MHWCQRKINYIEVHANGNLLEWIKQVNYMLKGYSRDPGLILLLDMLFHVIALCPSFLGYSAVQGKSQSLKINLLKWTQYHTEGKYGCAVL